MIVRKLQEARESARRVSAEGWESTRLLLADDRMGFSFHITRLFEGSEILIWYKNHLESVYIIEGEGELHTLPKPGEEEGFEPMVIKLEPGVMYALNEHDRHVLKPTKTITCACVFNPPLSGREVHDAEGAYSLDGEALGE